MSFLLSEVTPEVALNFCGPGSKNSFLNTYIRESFWEPFFKISFSTLQICIFTLDRTDVSSLVLQIRQLRNKLLK